MDFGSSRYAYPDANTYGYIHTDTNPNSYSHTDTDSYNYSYSYSYSDGYNDASAESYTNYDCERNTDIYSTT